MIAFVFDHMPGNIFSSPKPDHVSSIVMCQEHSYVIRLAKSFHCYFANRISTYRLCGLQILEVIHRDLGRHRCLLGEMSGQNSPLFSHQREIPETPNPYPNSPDLNLPESYENNHTQVTDTAMSNYVQQLNISPPPETYGSSSNDRTPMDSLIANIKIEVPLATKVELSDVNVTIECINEPERDFLPLRLYMGKIISEPSTDVWMYMGLSPDVQQICRSDLYNNLDGKHTVFKTGSAADLDRINLNPAIKYLKGDKSHNYLPLTYFTRYIFLLKCTEVGTIDMTDKHVPINKSFRRYIQTALKRHSDHRGIEYKDVEVIPEHAPFKLQPPQGVSHTDGPPNLRPRRSTTDMRGTYREAETSDTSSSLSDVPESDDGSTALPRGVVSPEDYVQDHSPPYTAGENLSSPSESPAPPIPGPANPAFFSGERIRWEALTIDQLKKEKTKIKDGIVENLVDVNNARRIWFNSRHQLALGRRELDDAIRVYDRCVEREMQAYEEFHEIMDNQQNEANKLCRIDNIIEEKTEESLGGT